MTIKVSPLDDGLPFGARVVGVTEKDVGSAGIRQQLTEVFAIRGMIVFEEVEPSFEMQEMISGVFGPPRIHPIKDDYIADPDKRPGLVEVGEHDKGPIVEIDGKPLIGWQPWHFDHCYNDALNRAGVLRAVIIPPEGGLTGFSDGIQIYNDMAPDVRAMIEDLKVIYKLDVLYPSQRFSLPHGFREIRPNRAQDRTIEMAKTMPRSVHPAVWTRWTGEKVIHISPNMAQGIEGMETPEGDELLRTVWAEILKTMVPYYHQWKPTDMVIWDNWRMIHQASGCDPKYERLLHRTTIEGDYGLGRFKSDVTKRETVPEMM
jgi:taurine dioxygenase